jgi:CheY-like chemotaxis protein
MPNDRTVIVFDDEQSERLPLIKELLGKDVKLKWFDYFSSEAIDRGETAVFVWPEQLSKHEISLLLIDLAVVRKAEAEDGIRVLRRLRAAFPNLPAFVISDSDRINDLKIRRQLRALDVSDDHIFFWPELMKGPGPLQEKFRNEAKRILAKASSEKSNG